MKARRRGNSEGSIYQRKDGRWVASVSLDRGKRKSFYGDTREEVRKKLAVALKAHQDGLPLAPEQQTVGQYLEQWLRVARRNIRPRTAIDYEAVVRLHLNPALGRIRLARLTPQNVHALISQKMAEGFSPRRVQVMHTVLRRALRQAERWSLVARNVAALVERPRVQRSEVEPLSAQQAKRLLDSLQGDRLEALYTVALAVGLRRGEALALRWRDIDLEAMPPCLRVRQSLQRYSGELHFDEPKTKGSKRTIVLPQVTVQALRRHMTRQIQERLKAGSAWNDDGLVFTTSVGTAIDPRNLLRHFKAALRAAGLENKRFHDMRHTCASLLLAQGVPARVVMEVLGHSAIGTTMNVYAHVMPALERDAANKMDAALSLTAIASP